MSRYSDITPEIKELAKLCKKIMLLTRSYIQNTMSSVVLEMLVEKVS